MVVVLHAPSVSTFLGEWLARTSVRDTTYRHYAGNVTRYISPFIGDRRIDDLAPDILRAWHTDLRTLVSGTTTQHAHITLSAALGTAVPHILPVNPCRLVRAPRRDTAEMQAWTPDEARRFLSVAGTTPLHALFRVAVTTGMRRGEMLGLSRRAVDLSVPGAAVQRALVQDRSGAWVIGDVKTASSRRFLYFDATTAIVVAHHLTTHDHDLVFARTDGRPYSPSALRGQMRRIAAEAGVQQIRFHDMRHTAATLMLRNQESPHVVARRLGHASVATTLRLYAHVSPDMQMDAAQRLGDLLDG